MSPTPVRAALAAVAIGAAAVFAVPAATATQADLGAAVRAEMLDRQGPAAATALTPLVEPTRAEGAWAFGSTTIPLPATAEHQTPKSALFLAQRERGQWRVELDGSAGFAALAEKAPARVLSAGEKETFRRNHAARNDTARTPVGALADTGLGLPWAQGVAWWMGGGPHGYAGANRPFNSIDFSGGNGQVGSAGPGRVYRTCVSSRSALMRVIHDNGWTTTYYHMLNLTTLADGSRVNTGTYLGTIGNELPCGGSSSGAHVHFSLVRGSADYSVHGMAFGGWTFYEGASAYGGYAERGGARVYTGGQITNFGPGSPPSQYPTGVVHAGSGSYVNLRSGPGVGYAVVGSVNHGATVSIVCTARGDTVQGVWGATNLWNRLTTGTWISDGFVDTGTSNPVAPNC